VGELDPRYVKGNGAVALRDRQHLGCRHILDLGLAINEAMNQPGTRQSIDLGTFTGDPFNKGLRLQAEVRRLQV